MLPKRYPQGLAHVLQNKLGGRTSKGGLISVYSCLEDCLEHILAKLIFSFHTCMYLIVVTLPIRWEINCCILGLFSANEKVRDIKTKPRNSAQMVSTFSIVHSTLSWG